MKAPETAKRAAWVMVWLGVFSFASVVTSIVVGVFMAWIHQFLVNSLYIFALTFAININTFLLNRYFNKRFDYHGKTEPKNT